MLYEDVDLHSILEQIDHTFERTALILTINVLTQFVKLLVYRYGICFGRNPFIMFVVLQLIMPILAMLQFSRDEIIVTP